MNCKVCIFSTVHRALDVRIFKEAKTLANHGYKVTLIAQHGQNETIDNINIIALSAPLNRLRRFFGMWHVLRIALKTHATVYHFHDPELIFIGLILKICGKKVIYDVHEDVPADIFSKKWIPRIFRVPFSWIFNSFEKLISRTFDQIITVGEFISKKFKNKNIVEIYNYPLINNYPERKRNKILAGI